jgi:alpha-1,2-glucosyltransferase
LLVTPIPFASATSRRQLGWLIVAVAWLMASAMAWHGDVISDEWVHYPQILRMRAGDLFGIDPSLTMLTGYHGLIAALMKLSGAESLGAARLFGVAFGVIAVWCFHGLRREIAGAPASLATQQFALLPILFPFFFLAYTDVLALAMVLGAMWAGLRRQHALAGLVLLASLLVRQNNVIWAGFIAAWCLWPVWQGSGWRPWRAWRESLRIGVPYAIVVLAFVGYWLWHGRISVSETQSYAHPDVSWHVGNPYFALAMLAALLPLQTIAGVRRFVAMLKARPVWILLPIAAFALYAAAFAVDHPYNHVALRYNLRNQWLLFVDRDTIAGIVFGLVATLGACAVVANGALRRQGWLLLPFAGIALAAAWLIEPRYSLIPFAIYLAIRPAASAFAERATLALWAALAVYLAIGIFTYRFMI